MTKQELIDYITIAHAPEAALADFGSVYQVWSDGEITLQKGGLLLWKRTLHRLSPPLATKIDPAWFPEQNEGFGYVFADDMETAEELRNMIRAFTETD